MPTATALPPPAIGSLLTLYTITGQTIASDGTLTDASTLGSPYILLNYVDEFDIENNPQMEDFATMVSGQAHHVPYRDDFTFTVNEVMPNTSGGLSPFVSSKLIQAHYNWIYFKFNITYDGNTWLWYGSRGRLSRQGRAGKNIVSATFHQIAVNAIGGVSGNPVYGTSP